MEQPEGAGVERGRTIERSPSTGWFVMVPVSRGGLDECDTKDLHVHLPKARTDSRKQQPGTWTTSATESGCPWTKAPKRGQVVSMNHPTPGGPGKKELAVSGRAILHLPQSQRGPTWSGEPVSDAAPFCQGVSSQPPGRVEKMGSSPDMPTARRPGECVRDTMTETPAVAPTADLRTLRVREVRSRPV